MREFESPIEPALRSLFASHVTMEVLNYVLTEYSFTVRKVLSIYLPTMEIVFRDVLRTSACKTCGSTSLRDNQQLYFDNHALLGDEVL